MKTIITQAQYIELELTCREEGQDFLDILKKTKNNILSESEKGYFTFGYFICNVIELVSASSFIASEFSDFLLKNTDRIPKACKNKNYLGDKAEVALWSTYHVKGRILYLDTLIKRIEKLRRNSLKVQNILRDNPIVNN